MDATYGASHRYMIFISKADKELSKLRTTQTRPCFQGNLQKGPSVRLRSCYGPGAYRTEQGEGKESHATGSQGGRVSAGMESPRSLADLPNGQLFGGSIGQANKNRSQNQNGLVTANSMKGLFSQLLETLPNPQPHFTQGFHCSYCRTQPTTKTVIFLNHTF